MDINNGADCLQTHFLLEHILDEDTVEFLIIGDNWVQIKECGVGGHEDFSFCTLREARERWRTLIKFGFNRVQ